MGRQQQVIDRLVDEGLVDADTADELCSARGDDAAAALLVDTDVDEEALLQQLALCFDLPPAGYLEGLFIERDLLEHLDTELIRKYEIFPVRQRGDEGVDVVTVEPLNELADQIVQEEMKLPIHQYIWPRIRFLQALHFFLGDDIPDWTRSYLHDHPVSMGYATIDGDINVGEALKSSASLHVLQWHRSDVREFIENCFDRDTLLKVLLGYAGHWLTSRLMVIFGKKGIQPYFVEEWPELEAHHDDVEPLREIRAETSTDALIKDDSWQYGDAEALGLDPLFEAFDVEPPPFLVAIPVHIGSRPAMSIVGVPADRDAAVRLDDDFIDCFDVDGLERAARWVGSQLQGLIKLAKKDALPPPADRVPCLPHPNREFGLGVEESLIEQTIARRQDRDKQRHRWEIVDISEVIEDSSTEQESAEEESDDADSESSTLSDDDSPVVGAIAEALASDNSTDGAIDDRSEESTEESTDESLSSVEATSYGMPSLSDDLAEEIIDDAGDEDESNEGMPDVEADDQSDAELGAEPSDSVLPDASSDAVDDDKTPDGERSPSAHQVTPFPHAVSGEEPDLDPVMERTPSSDALVADSGDTVEVESSDKGGPTTSENFSTDDVANAVDNDDETSSDDDAHESSEPESTPDPSPGEEEPVDEDISPASKEAGNSPLTGAGPSGLQIPANSSGVPMAQILRRPRRGDSCDDDRPAEERDSGDEMDRDVEEADAITGRTITGVGEVLQLDDESSAPMQVETAGQAQDETTRELHSQSRPEATAQLGGSTSSTQNFGELINDMAPDLSPDSPSSFEPRPKTIPGEVIEELSEAGPVAVDFEQSVALIEDGDQKKAFAAAEHLATAGADILPALKSLFPGRLFVDRYQYTADTLPPVNEHGPVLEALVRIGDPSLEVVESFLDHTSPEYRFYSTFLLTELPATNLLSEIRDQLFDRDRQTRKVARKIIIAHRHVDQFESIILTPLRSVLEENTEAFRVEIAVEILCHFKDVASIPLLIEALQGAGDHLRKTLHRALRTITYQPLAPSPTEWRRWWHHQGDEKRWMWLVQAMNSDDHDIRRMVFDEIEQIPGLKLDYHPDQPKKLRARAQDELTKFFEQHGR